ncbi:MAG: von Willebrand factor type A domain-containing protein [Gemmatimonadota bacterium]
MFRSSLLAIGAAALLAATQPTSPATGVAEVSGLVTDAVTGRPLVGAQVSTVGQSFGSLTGSDGRFLLMVDDGLVGAELTIEVYQIGYGAARKTVRVTDSGSTLDFALQPTAIALEGVVVTGTAGQARRRAIGNTVAPAAADGSSARVLGAGVAHFRTRGPVESASREGYAHIAENDFAPVASSPVSTFSIDVDRASYANVRRFLNQGVRPPVDAVRIEELINYFPYDDAAPYSDDEHPFTVSTEVAPAPWAPEHHLLRIGLKGVEIDLDDAPANNLVFLLDVSGSMGSADKLPLLKTAFELLIDELRPQDRVAIVVYAGAAGLVLPSTPGSDRDTILEALRSLNAGGSTAGGAGINLAYSVAQENFIEGGNNRVILATDGDFNVGASSDAEMIRLIEEKREGGTFLTVLGFGTGNLQDAKMEQIADHGNGNFSYIDSRLEAQKVLVNELGGTLVTIAKDVKIQVEFNPARVAAYRLIGYENRLLATEDFNDDTKDAGELGAGHSVTALYEIVPVGADTDVEIRDVDPLRYQRPDPSAGADNEELLFVKLRYKEPTGTESRLLTRTVGDIEGETSDDFRFSAAVAAWGMLLRSSEHCGDFTLADVARLARGAVGDDRHGYRADFLQLLDRARAADILAAEPGGRR